MAITLRDNTSTNTGKGSELTYSEMDTNLESFYYSSSIDGTNLLLHTTGSTTHTIGLGGFSNSIYTADGTVTGNRNITFDKGAFNLTGTLNSFNVETTEIFFPLVTDHNGVGTTKILIQDPTDGRIWVTGSDAFGGIASNTIYTSNGTITGNRTVTFTNGSLTLTGGLTYLLVETDEIFFPDIPIAGNNTVAPLVIDTSTGRLFYTNSSNSNTPAGTDGQIQFNDGGTSFGGDSGLTYDKTANRLTITAPSNPNRTSPNLLLNSELSNVTVGEVLGVIAANNTTDQFNPANYPASIQFTAEANFGPGLYDAGIRFYTNDAAIEKEALRLINTGQNRLPQYGAGTFTGTAAKWLAVDSSGNVIEENAPSGGSKNYTRSSEVTHTVHTKVSSVAYQLQGGATGAGNLAIDGLGSPGATVNASAVSYLWFNVNDNTGTNREKTLKYLCKWTSNPTTGNADSATVTVADNGASGWLAQFNINGVVETSTGVYRVAVSGGSNTTIGSSFGSVLDVSFNSFALIPLQDNEWNRILIEQYSLQDSSGQKHGIILQAPPTWQPFGTRGIVEVKCAAQEQLTVWYAKNMSQGTTGTYNYNIPTSIKSAKHIQQTATTGLSTHDSKILTVGRSNTAILEVMSVQIAGTAPGLSVLGVDLITGF